MRLYRLVPALLGLCLASAFPERATGQAAGEAVRVFMDCQTVCDFDHTRQEITYINWVRERQDAAVHLLITSQTTGGGGREFILRFIGLGAFQGLDDEIKFVTLQTDTEDDTRRAMTQRIGLGLARYVARGSFADQIRVTFTAPAGAAAAQVQQPKDPWNFWVFRIGANGFFQGESQRRADRVSGSVRASRVTEQWKFQTQVGGNRFHQRQELPDSTVFTSTTSSYNLSSLLVRSLGQHWSLGVLATGLRSTRSNYDLLGTITPEIEYNVFPYKESSRRQLVLVYAAGLSHANYEDTTIYDKLKETRPLHRFTAAVEAVQPWGSVRAQLVASNYLDDFSTNRISVGGGFEVRIVRGLRVDLFGEYSRVRDQLSLLKAGLSEEDILLQLKQLATGYFYYMSVGLSYSFGSKFNNVVNPRLSNADRGSFDCC